LSDARRVVGQSGEDAAAAWYEAAGYQVLDRRDISVPATANEAPIKARRLK